MKNFFAFSLKALLVMFLCVVFLLACASKPRDENGTTMDADTSYAFGMLLAEQAVMPGLHLDYDEFIKGFRDFSEANETRLTRDESMEKIRATITQLQSAEAQRMQAEGAVNLEAGEAFLAENGAKSGVTTTASGLQYEVVTEGSGAKPALNDTVRVNYEGTLIDGTKFDSSYDRGEPAEFPVSGVIPGWVEGLQLMSEGSEFRFVIPSNLAYGPNSPSPDIPPNSTLIFKVELLSVVK